MVFEKGYTPWNKGKKGCINSGSFKKGHEPWHKDKTNVYSEKTLKVMSEHKLGKSSWNKGLKGQTNNGGYKVGHKFSKETIEKIRQSQIDRNLTGERNPFYGKHHTEETRLKIKQARAKQIFPLKDSSIEVKIQSYLDNLGIKYLKHKYISDIKNAYQCDIFIPESNLVIECDGNYWHNYPLGLEKDVERNKQLKEAGYKILRFWESEIKEITLPEFERKLKQVA